MKIFKIIAATLVCLALLASCTGDSSDVVISYDGTTSADISANMYNYWASTSKANFIYSYTDIKDTEEFWQSEYEDGKTYAQYLDSLVLEDIKTTAVCLSLYNEMRLSLTDSQREAIDKNIDGYLSEYAGGNKNTLNRALSAYGANMTILREIKEAEAKRTLVYDFLFSEGGEKALSAEDYEKYYQDNYYHFQIIYINNKYEYVLDDKGNYTTNADGTYVTRALSGDALDKKNQSIKNVTDGIEAGEDFDSLFNTYSEQKTYANGYYFTASDSYANAVFYKLIADIAETEIGETVVSEYDSGTYIMKRLPLDENAWNQSINKDFFNSFKTLAANAAFRVFCAEQFDALTIDAELISKYSVSKIKANDLF
ncbi:MAG: hypothetical protein IKL36_06640 [Clostridia bacterium]|nr:hypothetical protein [Clostridia bacterium]